MIIPLLATKFHVPPWHAAVSRPRLLERLTVGLNEQRNLTLVSAPAGYGKSTLVSEWLTQIKKPAAWLSLDETDDEQPYFDYLCYPRWFHR
jgi:LuxR family transcriptional regulator, maltose regulon positive regulatory protein